MTAELRPAAHGSSLVASVTGTGTGGGAIPNQLSQIRLLAPAINGYIANTWPRPVGGARR
jgi:hypothetical protein